LKALECHPDKNPDNPKAGVNILQNSFLYLNGVLNKEEDFERHIIKSI